MGFSQGKSFRHKISRAEEILEKTELFRRFVPSFISLPFLINAAQAILPVFVPSILSKEKDLLDRLNGIADGANAGRELIFLGQALEVVLDQIPYHPGCTSAGIMPEKFSGNEPVLIKNFDFIETFRVFNMIRHSVPKRGIESFEMGLAPMCGTHMGMNRAGLSITYNYGFSRENPMPRIPVTCLIQLCLERFERTEEAINFFLNRHFPNGAILLVCDKDSRMAAIEGSPSHKAMRYPDRNGFLVCTNRFMSGEMQDAGIPKNAMFSETMPYGLEKVRVHESNEKRAERLHRLFGSVRKVSEDLLIKALCDHGEENKPGDGTVCRHFPLFHTTASAILFPKTRRAYFLIGSPCKNVFHKYGF